MNKHRKRIRWHPGPRYTAQILRSFARRWARILGPPEPQAPPAPDPPFLLDPERLPLILSCLPLPHVPTAAQIHRFMQSPKFLTSPNE